MSSFHTKWRTIKLGKLKLSINELRELHTGTGFKSGCGTNYVGRYISIYWNGTEKLTQIIGLHAEHKFISEIPHDN